MSPYLEKLLCQTKVTAPGLGVGTSVFSRQDGTVDKEG